MPAGLIFVVSGIVVVLAGAQLARAGETIAERTGLGSAWVGAILVAGATSLPELTTDLFAARQGHAELAVGDLFGSCMFNLVILAVADMLLIRVRVMTRVAINQAVVGMLSIVLMATAAAGMLTDSELSIVGIGWSPLAVGFGYLAGMRLIHANRAGPPFMTPEQASRAHLRRRVHRHPCCRVVSGLIGRRCGRPARPLDRLHGPGPPRGDDLTAGGFSDDRQHPQRLV